MILFISSLIELVAATSSCTTCFIFLEILENIFFSNILFSTLLSRSSPLFNLLRNSLELLLHRDTSISQSLILLSLNLSLFAFNGILILREVSAVQCQELREPNLDCGSEILILVFRVEHRVHRVLHHVQMLQHGELLAQVDEEGIENANAIVRER